MRLSRLGRKFAHIFLTATDYKGDPAAVDTVEVGLLAPNTKPTTSTVWTPVSYSNGEATVLLSGPDADADEEPDAIVINSDVDLWVRVSVDPEIDIAKIERIELR